MREDQPSVRPSRVIIDRMEPSIDNGRFAAKAIEGQDFEIRAVLLCDGHDLVHGGIEVRHEQDDAWQAKPLLSRGNDIFTVNVKLDRLGRYFYRAWAAIDRFAVWKRDLVKRLEAGQAVDNDLQAGIALLETWGAKVDAPKVAKEVHGPLQTLRAWAKTPPTLAQVATLVGDERLNTLAQSMRDETSVVADPREYPVQVDPKLAEFSAWYEFFPRSCSGSVQKHGSLKDAEARLEYAARMGFNVVYLPPVHPIGREYRKGRNNALKAQADDVGSPWAIGAKEGGHKDLHPELGTFADFERFVKKARSLGLDIALDIAFQVAPDHPYVKAHEEWFKKRPDGTIQYAENPPKKYQDIYPFDFESTQWSALWDELKSVFLFWIQKGVRVFRVDNPHTKAFEFWEWCIREVKREHPEVLFLAEAFTRPHIMAYLGKAGFSQSYTYFTWRNTKWELAEYMRQLTGTDLALTFRPNFWPNTPDILPEALQEPSRASYLQRLILAATLSSNYGIYGPAFELMDYRPREANSEEYLNSEKYEIKVWDLARPDSLAPVIQRLNRIRRENPALQSNAGYVEVPTNNDQLFAYLKQRDANAILCVVNLDRHNRQGGMLDLPLKDIGLDEQTPYEVHDLLSDARYTWRGRSNYVELEPSSMPAHIFAIRGV